MTIVTAVAVWFALNPERELTVRDVAERFGVSANSVGHSLSGAAEKGWVVKERRPASGAPRGFRNVYRIGPRIARAIKERQDAHG